MDRVVRGGVGSVLGRNWSITHRLVILKCNNSINILMCDGHSLCADTVC